MGLNNLKKNRKLRDYLQEQKNVPIPVLILLLHTQLFLACYNNF